MFIYRQVLTGDTASRRRLLGRLRRHTTVGFARQASASLLALPNPFIPRTARLRLSQDYHLDVSSGWPDSDHTDGRTRGGHGLSRFSRMKVQFGCPGVGERSASTTAARSSEMLAGVCLGLRPGIAGLNDGERHRRPGRSRKYCDPLVAGTEAVKRGDDSTAALVVVLASRVVQAQDVGSHEQSPLRVRSTNEGTIGMPSSTACRVRRNAVAVLLSICSRSCHGEFVQGVLDAVNSWRICRSRPRKGQLPFGPRVAEFRCGQDTLPIPEEGLQVVLELFHRGLAMARSTRRFQYRRAPTMWQHQPVRLLSPASARGVLTRPVGSATGSYWSALGLMALPGSC